MGAIGRYEIESLIGKGAMGVVFLARDPQLGRRVALKTYDIPEGVSEEVVSEFEERLLREAHAAAALSHPNIVTVHDAGVDAGRGFPYIVMEYVPGSSLKEILEGPRRLALDLGVRFGDALADALDAAHRAGIVHRDIKPANILVRENDGLVKITDFGVARLAASELTRTGALVGSPAYMSPEQIRGAEVDARSDLFSLAVVMYEALTARRPFSGDDLPAVAYSVVHEAVAPPSRQVPGLPRAMDAFFERALAKDPDERFQDGAAFRTGLKEACGAATAPRKTRGGRRATRAAAAAESPAESAEEVAQEIPEAGEADAGGGEADAERALRAAGEPGETEEEGADRNAGRAGEPSAVDAPSSETRRLRSGLGTRIRLIVVALFFLLTLGGVPYLFATRPAHLKLEAKSSIENGALTLRLDGRPIYTRTLSAPHDATGVGWLTVDNESFEAWLKVPSGKHTLAAEVVSGGSGGLGDSIVLELSPGENRTLRLNAGGGPGQPVQMRVE